MGSEKILTISRTTIGMMAYRILIGAPRAKCVGIGPSWWPNCVTYYSSSRYMKTAMVATTHRMKPLSYRRLIVRGSVVGRKFALLPMGWLTIGRLFRTLRVTIGVVVTALTSFVVVCAV